MPLIFFLSYVVEWSVASFKKECAGTEIFVGNFANVGHCADACQKKSSMFIHSRKTENENACFCETSSLKDGTCKQIDNSNYNLYRYGHTKGKL